MIASCSLEIARALLALSKTTYSLMRQDGTITSAEGQLPNGVERAVCEALERHACADAFLALYIERKEDQRSVTVVWREKDFPFMLYVEMEPGKTTLKTFFSSQRTLSAHAQLRVQSDYATLHTLHPDICEALDTTPLSPKTALEEHVLHLLLDPQISVNDQLTPNPKRQERPIVAQKVIEQ